MMKANFFQKKAIIIAGNLAAIAFTSVGAITATYAWFASQDTVSATGMQVQCAAPDGTLTYEILKYDENQKQGVSSTDASDFYLPAYDQYIQSKNYYCNAIIVATINFSDGFTSANDIVITTTCTADYKDSDNKITSNTSNVVAFKSFIYSYTYDGTETIIATDIERDTDDTDEDAAKRYDSAVEKFDGITSESAFVSGSPKAKTNTITNTCSSTSITNADSITIYFECIYNSTLVNDFINSVGYSMEGEISLTADVTNIAIGKGII